MDRRIRAGNARCVWFCLSLFALCTFVVGRAQTVPQVPRKTLTPASSSLTEVPTFSAYLPIRCDARGNLYFHLGADVGAYSSGAVMRLSRDSNLPTLFKAPVIAGKKLSFIEFSVTPSGQTWLLEQTPDGGYEVFGYAPGEDAPDDIRLDLPDHLELTDFVVSENAVLLLGGYYDGSAGKERGGKPYLAMFDKSGRVRKDLSSEGLEGVKLDQVRKELHDGAATAGPDGSFYFVQGSEMLVLSGNGDLVRRVPIQKPDKEMGIDSVIATGDLISIELRRAGKDGMIQVQYLVLNAATGEPYSLYTPSEELGNNCVCFSRSTGYTFLRVQNGKLKLLTAPLT